MRSAAAGQSQLGARRQKTDLHVAVAETSHARSASPAPSLRSQRAKQYRATLPVRTARLLQRSRAPTPSEPSCASSEGTASPVPPASAILLQDVVDIKTLLLQLKRVLQEPGEEHHSTSSETLDPLLAACSESPARGNGRLPPPAPASVDPAHEMRRQILYLQSQLEERDRLVRVLQQQMLRMEGAGMQDGRHDDTCNRATQTDRLRPPVTSSGALASSDNSSGLVSWNEHASGRKLPLYSEAQKTKNKLNSTVKICQCGGRKVNATDSGNPSATRTNSRVGSKYIQALQASNDTNNRRYVKRDSSLSEPQRSKTTLYSSRSRSIENFQNHPYSLTEPLFAKNTVIEETIIKHHTSYGDLYNGRISNSSKESVNGHRHSPSLNGQSTDTDYSSDGGYKSLPSSINSNGLSQSPKKISGIPRRSIERKFISTKQVRASAV